MVGTVAMVMKCGLVPTIYNLNSLLSFKLTSTFNIQSNRKENKKFFTTNLFFANNIQSWVDFEK